MTAEDALAYLVDADAARRTLEGRRAANRLGLVGIANKRLLVAWRRENQLCPKCGRGLPANEPFKHCERCRRAFRQYQRHVNANLTERQRLLRNERARRSYHKLAHGKAPPAKVVTREVVTPLVTEVVTPLVTEVVTPAPMVTVVTPKVRKSNLWTATKEQTAAGPKRDRAEYMREYRASRAK